jgi:hypothetical protein
VSKWNFTYYFITAGANHYIALFNDTAALKVARCAALYTRLKLRFRSSLRAAVKYVYSANIEGMYYSQ